MDSVGHTDNTYDYEYAAKRGMRPDMRAYNQFYSKGMALIV